MIERHITLRKAARASGRHHQTIKRWLEQDLGIVFPRVRHGASLLVLERDVEDVLARRRDVRNVPSPSRPKRK